MKKIAVSACLLGIPCRYDGNAVIHDAVKEYVKDKEVFLICPEQLGGLPTPRFPCEIKNEKVVNQQGVDKTAYFVEGANKVLKQLQDARIGVAILKSKSPSCGVKQIYDGTFNRHLIAGQGICAQILSKEGIQIIDSDDICLQNNDSK